MKENITSHCSTKDRLWIILSTSNRGDIWSIVDDIIIYSIIILNTLLVGLNSFKKFPKSDSFSQWFESITLASVVVLAVHLIISLWACTSQPQFSKPVLGRIRLLLSPIPFLELVIITCVILFGPSANIIFLLMIKMSRVAEYFGDGDEYSPSMILKRSLLNKKEELFITVLFSTGMLLLCSFIIFYFEGKAQPDKFESIVPSIGWVFGVVTETSLVDFTPVTLIGKVFHVIMVVLGIVIVGLPVGIITGSFVEQITEAKTNRILRERSNLLLQAFDFEQKINIRTLVATLGLASERKTLDIDFAMARLEFSQDEIFEAARFSKSLRLRACKQDKASPYEDNLVLEAYPANASFGSFINRESNVHIVSAQSVGEMAIGHFSRQLASILNANYYSNEFFSSANLLKETQVNFAINDLYLSERKKDMPSALLDWFTTLRKHIKPQDYVIYVSAASADRSPTYHILFGGAKGQEDFSEIQNPTVDDVEKIEGFYADLSEKLSVGGLSITSHSAFGNTKMNHLSHVIRNTTKANVLSLYVSHNLLQYSPLNSYYQNVSILSECVKRNLLQLSSN